MSSLTQEQLNKSLWAAADDMRKSMSADDYKDYLLGLVFFKNLSDEILYEVVDLVENRKPESLDEAQRIFERYYLSEDKDLLDFVFIEIHQAIEMCNNNSNKNLVFKSVLTPLIRPCAISSIFKFSYKEMVTTYPFMITIPKGNVVYCNIFLS